jgi:hypothetical protein
MCLAVLQPQTDRNEDHGPPKAPIPANNNPVPQIIACCTIIPEEVDFRNEIEQDTVAQVSALKSAGCGKYSLRRLQEEDGTGPSCTASWIDCGRAMY